MSDQEGHDSVDESYAKSQEGDGPYSLSPLQDCSTRFWANLQRRHDLTARKSPFSDHIGKPSVGYDRQVHLRRESGESQSDWLADRLGYESTTPKSPFTISPAACLLEMDPDIELEMLYPLDRAKPTLHVQLDVGVKGNQAGLVMVEAESFGLNVRQRAIYQPTNNEHSKARRFEKWSNNLRPCDDESSSKGIFTGRINKLVDSRFFSKKVSFQGPYDSKSSAEIGELDLLSLSGSKETITLDIFGRDYIRWWKDGPGSSKDWRTSRYLKSPRKGEQEKYQFPSLRHRSYVIPSRVTNDYPVITQFPPYIVVPKDMLRQKSTSCQGHSSYLKPKSSWRAMYEMGLNQKTILPPKSRARCKPWITNAIDSFDIEEAWRPRDEFNAELEVSK